MPTRNIPADDQTHGPEPFVVDKESDEYKRWVPYAQRALRYGETTSPEELVKSPTDVLEYVAQEYGVSPSAMGLLALYL